MSLKVNGLLQGQQDNYIFPFFWQHGEGESVLREYMQKIDEANMKAVCIESRPHPDFCGAKWWEDMDVILDEARKRGMKVWILDDSHFPTGYANGALADKPDELCRQSICCKIFDVEEGSRFVLDKEQIRHPEPFQKSMVENYVMTGEIRQFEDDKLFSLYAVRQDQGGFTAPENRINLAEYLGNEELSWQVPEGKWKVYVLHLSRNFGYHRSYINMMDRESCKVLLDAVYEPHYEHYREDFGKTIAGFFSDEPELGNGHLYENDDPFGSKIDYPWSRELETALREKMGSGFEALMPLLWETQADEKLTARVRYIYMDTVSNLVKEDFSRQIGDWCHSHGVQYIGHLIEDDNHHSRTGSSLGHYFRGLYGQDMAGIDDIGGQVFPQGEDVSYNNGVFQHRNGEFYHYLLGKLASSAAAVEPKKQGSSMCEIFGNYGWDEGVRLEKYLVDHFMVRGINHFVPHAFSPKEFPDPDCPPHFYAHGNNPQFRHFGALMKYTNRICELISGGRHTVSAAVLYHGEGDWMGQHMTVDKIGHVLYDNQIDYDVIPADVFAEREAFHVRMEKGMLHVNTQGYPVIIVPFMQFITGNLAESLLEAERNDIPVVFAGDRPEVIGIAESVSEDICQRFGKAGSVLPLEKLPEMIREKKAQELEITPADNRVRFLRYIHKDGSIVYFLINEGTKTWQGTVHFLKETSDCPTVYEYDAWENRILEPKKDGNDIKMTIEPLKSRVVVFDYSGENKEILDNLRKDCGKCEDELVSSWQEFSMEKAWTRSICRSIDYPAFGNAETVMLPDCLAEAKPDFSGFVRYENTFMAHRGDKVMLVIADAAEGVEVFVNDKSMGIQIVPEFRYDLSEALADGENRLRIEVATTLSREMSKYPNVMGQIVESSAKSGIVGDVKIFSGR